jgi:hypothetical protein
MAQIRQRNLHIIIPEHLYEALRREADRRGQPATQLVRALLEQWEEPLRAQSLHGEIADYAGAQAGTAANLDPGLEAAGIGVRLEATRIQVIGFQANPKAAVCFSTKASRHTQTSLFPHNMAVSGVNGLLTSSPSSFLKLSMNQFRSSTC